MKAKLLLLSSVLITSGLIHADIITPGTPTDSIDNPPKGVSPRFGQLINFDSLAQSVNPVSSLTTQGATISSPDGLLVIPFSTQSAPNEVFDNSSNGTANLTIKLTLGVTAIGIGIADSDGVAITIQALDSSGNPFGTAFPVNVLNSGVNPGNGYWVVSDTTADLFGLKITQSTGNANFSGLAIDDLQVAPEPGSIFLFGAAVSIFGFMRLRRKQA